MVTLYCYYCNGPIDDTSDDIGKRGLHFPPPSNPGVVCPQHVGCVQERLRAALPGADDELDGLRRLFVSIEGKLKASNGSLRSALKDVEAWTDAAKEGKATLERVQKRVAVVTEKAADKIKDLKRKAISCCFCGCDNESLAALKEHSATCPEHPAVKALCKYRGFDDAELEAIRTFDMTAPNAIRDFFALVESRFDTNYGSIAKGGECDVSTRVLDGNKNTQSLHAGLENSEFWWFATGGWSDNEEVIDAVAGNQMAHLLTWRMSMIGGLHVYEVGDLAGEGKLKGESS